VLDKNKPLMEVSGIPGAAYEQRQDDEANKLYNKFGLEVEITEDGLGVVVTEKMPEGMAADEAKIETEIPKPDNGPLTYGQTKDSTLTIHERARIVDENDPNYMGEDDIKSELTTRNVSFDKRMGRKKLVAILQNEIGV
jgi:hypothetical protein